jgi:hypothetical protein
MVSYLFSVTPFERLTSNDHNRLILDIIYNYMYGKSPHISPSTIDFRLML